MTAPLTTLRNRYNTEPHRYLLDDAFDYLLTKEGRENVALVLLIAASVAGIVVCARA